MSGEYISGKLVCGVEKGHEHFVQSGAYSIGSIAENLEDDFVLEGLPFTENYHEGRLDLCFFLAVGQIAKNELLVDGDDVLAIRCRHQNRAATLDLNASLFTDEIAKTASRKIRDAPGEDQQAVLVADIEGMNPAKYGILTRARVEAADRFFDLFSGELYLSAINGSCKGVITIPLGEGKLDIVGTRGALTRQREQHQVERGSKVVNCIAEDKGEGWRDAFLCFDAVGNLTGLSAIMGDDLERDLREKDVDLPSKVIDVMFGPL